MASGSNTKSKTWEATEFYHLQALLSLIGAEAGFMTPLSHKARQVEMDLIMHIMAVTLQKEEEMVCTLVEAENPTAFVLTCNLGFTPAQQSWVRALFQHIANDNVESARAMVLQNNNPGWRPQGDKKSRRLDKLIAEERKASERVEAALSKFPPRVSGQISHSDLREWLKSEHCFNRLVASRCFSEATLEVVSAPATESRALSITTLDTILQSMSSEEQVYSVEELNLRLNDEQMRLLLATFNNQSVSLVRHSECQSMQLGAARRIQRAYTTKLGCWTCVGVAEDHPSCNLTGGHGALYPRVEAPAKTITRLLPQMKTKVQDWFKGAAEPAVGCPQSQDALFNFLHTISSSIREERRHKRVLKRS